MERAELEAALAECEGHTPGVWKVRKTIDNSGDYPVPDYDVLALMEFGPQGVADAWQNPRNANLIALAPALASALRSAWAEIDRLQVAFEVACIQLQEIKQLGGTPVNPSLDAALNENDGSYRP